MSDDGLEPAAWMAYNDRGGAGLVPYLTRKQAERATSENNKPEFPKPLYYGSGDGDPAGKRGVRDLLNEVQDEASGHPVFNDDEYDAVKSAFDELRRRLGDVEEKSENGDGR